MRIICSVGCLILPIVIVTAATSGSGDAVPAPAPQAAGAGNKWPGDERRMVFCCRNPVNAVRVRDLDGKSALEPGVYYELESHGSAVLGPYSSMRLEGGVYAGLKGTNAMASAFKSTSQLTLEAVICSGSSDQDGPAEIVSLSTDTTDYNCCLAQVKDTLVFKIKTAGGGGDWHTLCRVTPDRAAHIAVTYESGRLVCYLDGKEVFTEDKVKGSLAGWTPHPVALGNNLSGKRPWRGLLENVALYARVLTPEEILKDSAACHAELAERKPIPKLVVQAKLLRAAKWPQPKTQTYPVATTVYEYEIEKVMEGNGTTGKVFVTHFIWADFALLAPAAYKEGVSQRLILEPCDAHAELAEIRGYESLERDPDAPLYLDMGPLVPLPKR